MKRRKLRIKKESRRRLTQSEVSDVVGGSYATGPMYQTCGHAGCDPSAPSWQGNSFCDNCASDEC